MKGVKTRLQERGHDTFAQKRCGMFASLHCHILQVYIVTNYRDILVHCLRTVHIVALYRNVYCTCMVHQTTRRSLSYFT